MHIITLKHRYSALLLSHVMNMARGIVSSLLQFDFSYSSAIIILNSLGLSAPKSNPIKAS